MLSQFDDLAELYEQFSTQPFRRELEFTSVLATLGRTEGTRVLDLGCGSGVYTRLLAGAGADVVGLDESAGMVDFARRRERERPCGATYLTGSLPADQHGRFDLVLGVYVLPYATTRAELAELCGVAAVALRPGGRFVTLPIHPGFHRDPAYYAPYGFRLHAYDPLDGAPVILNLWAGSREATVTARYWSAATLNHVLAEAGFARVTWLPHSVSEQGMAEYGRGYWAPYLTVPHAALLDCTKG
ncbi:class I SAM-dependent methyltransferase [Actinocrispum wychmicini]|uniref:Ubiquinone/menaquinone biosynthesis C-methylase UbiE n=1 Tax=Actinocrispum wychmicini TaxID=1213861 RepID=A0A4R2JI78_9PSEU|nr:class I SAM-dependent methyltransferase [Actinocrispum wychmicini]TCO59603.1 ubiquinone/menaquinone biosynthesis C-methylase UbiE [Actinocrispum wychmicini]